VLCTGAALRRPSALSTIHHKEGYSRMSLIAVVPVASRRAGTTPPIVVPCATRPVLRRRIQWAFHVPGHVV